MKKNDKGKDDGKKFTCPICSHHFNNVWLLKGHSEEEHKDMLSQEIIERYIENCNRESDDSNEQKDRSSPVSVASEREKEEAPASNNFSEVQEAFQRAMMNAQLQQMNPKINSQKVKIRLTHYKT